MLRSEIDDRLVRDAARICQIIVGALVAGVVMYLVMAVFVLNRDPPQFHGDSPVISLIAAGGFVGAVMMWMIVPKQLVAAQVVKLAATEPANQATPQKNPAVDPDLAKLLPLFQTKTIVANALLEGSAFFTTAAYSIERKPYMLGFALAAVALMLGFFPSRARLQDWLQTQQDRIDGIRQFGGSST